MKKIGKILTVFTILLAGAALASPARAEASELLDVTCPDVSPDAPYVFVDYTRPFILQAEDEDESSYGETYTWELIEGSKTGFSFVDQGNGHQQYFEVSEPGTYTVSATDSQGNSDSCTIEAIEASSRELSISLLEDRNQVKGGDYIMAAGDSTSLSLLYTVENGSGYGAFLDGTGDETITSSDTSVIRVNTGDEQILSAVGTGTAEVTLTFGENDYTKAITVLSEEELERLISKDGFILSEGVNKYFTDLSMKPGQEAYLYAHWDGMETNNGMTLDFYGDFTVTSDNEEIISIDQEGHLHAVAAGTANIIVKGKYTEYTFPVQVLSDAQAAVDGMELCDVENGNIFSSGDGRYGVYCEHPFFGNAGKLGTYSSADDYISGYESMDPDVFRVSETGEFTALKKGEATLKVHLTDGSVKEYTFIVKKMILPVFELRGLEAGIRPGETKQINATYDRDVLNGLDDYTEMYTNGSISVTSDNPDILSVKMVDDYYGAAEISAKREGTVILTVTEVNTETKQQFTLEIAEGSSTEEKTDEGTLTLNKDSDLPEINIPKYDELAGAVFTKEEIEGSTQRDVEIIVNQIRPEEDEKTRIEGQLKDGESAGLYLDISIVKTVWSDPYSYSTDTVTELLAPVRFTIEIPEELQGMENYFILRDHDGIIERLEDLDRDPDTVTFETDVFSTYLLAYEAGMTADDPKDPADDPKRPADDKKPEADGENGNAGNAEESKSEVVETGVNDMPLVWGVLMAAAISAVIVCRKKEN